MKILVVHVPAGAGHQRAAEAIAAALRERKVSAEVIVWDALLGTNRIYRWSFTKGYLRLIHQAPLLWGIAYHLTDIKIFRGPIQWLHRISNRSHGKHFEKYLIETQPDVIVGTHFFPMEVAGRLKLERRISSRVITVITDYLPHALWVAPGIDLYVVAGQEARQELIMRGVANEKIRIVGIPVDPKFSENGSRPELVRRLSLRTDLFTVLIGSGGAGTGPIVALLKAFNSVRQQLQILIVVGRNDSLFRQLEALRPSMRHAVQVYGFVNNMDELMAVSDVVVTKAGGLTCTEALVKGVPLLLVAPIPGQETRNAQAMTRMGAALWANRMQEIPGMIENLIRHPETLKRMGERGRQNAAPQAALEISKLVVP